MTKNIFSPLWESAVPAEKKRLLKESLGGATPLVVYVDDEADALEIFESYAQGVGLEAYTTSDTREALSFIGKNKSRIILIISDYSMPEIDGFQFRELSAGTSIDIPFAILSGHVDRELALKGLELKITAFLEKPLRPSDFVNFLKKEVEPRFQTLREEFEMLKGFTDDATNLLENIEELTLGLEINASNTDAIARIFGMIHTIKGSSGFFEPRDLHTFSHSFEEVLKECQSGARAISENLVSIILKGNDFLKLLVDEFKTGDHKDYDIPEMVKMFHSGLAETGNPKQALKEETNEHITSGVLKEQKASELRVPMVLLDEFMQTSGEMTVIRNMINKTVRSLEKQYSGDKEISLLTELLDEMHKINSDVQYKITDIRRVPVSSLVKPLSRIIRDTARALKKEVDFVIEGEELRLDNSIAEVLSNSLVHMMRNSLDHGIESPEKRKQLGKSPRGKILLRFSCQGEDILIDIHDDGAGINVERIREKVVEKGLRSLASAKKMTVEELQFMIFDSGLSTAQQVTDFSGRGVGMSMVRDSVASLRGKILIQSKENVGSEFRLQIPIPKSVMITNCLFVSIANKAYGIPQDNILKVMEKNQLPESDYSQIKGSEVIRFNGHLIPLCSLSRLMGIETRLEHEKLIVIMKTEESVFALRVESVQDIEDAVIKPLNFKALKDLDIYLGGTFLGDASIGLILNIEGVAKRVGISNSVHLGNNMAFDQKIDEKVIEQRNVIVFELQRPGHFCIEEKDILRIERIERSKIQRSGEIYLVPYRETVMTLIDVDQNIDPKFHSSLLGSSDDLPLATVIINRNGQYIGIVVKEIVDLKTAYGALEKNMQKHHGIEGCYVIDNKVVTLVNISDLLNIQETYETDAQKNFIRESA